VRKNITELPITKEIVKQANCIARQEIMSRGLKILTHNNTTLYNSTLLTGVDDDNMESTSDQESTQDQDHQEEGSTKSNHIDEDKKNYINQDTMDPNDIAALTQKAQEEKDINQTQKEEIEELDSQYQSENDNQD
jgi:hypothetical protein